MTRARLHHLSLSQTSFRWQTTLLSTARAFKSIFNACKTFLSHSRPYAYAHVFSPFNSMRFIGQLHRRGRQYPGILSAVVLLEHEKPGAKRCNRLCPLVSYSFALNSAQQQYSDLNTTSTLHALSAYLPLLPGGDAASALLKQTMQKSKK